MHFILALFIDMMNKGSKMFPVQSIFTVTSFEKRVKMTHEGSLFNAMWFRRNNIKQYVYQIKKNTCSFPVLLDGICY